MRKDYGKNEIGIVMVEKEGKRVFVCMETETKIDFDERMDGYDVLIDPSTKARTFKKEVVGIKNRNDAIRHCLRQISYGDEVVSSPDIPHWANYFIKKLNDEWQASQEFALQELA